MATELAKAYVQIVPSAKGITGEISKAINPEADSAGHSFGTSLVSRLKKTIAAAVIGKTLKQTIAEGADLEQSVGGIETLFKESAAKVRANAAEAYRTAGMSANEYMELTTSFSASLLSSLAKDTNKAADIANMAMVDMSDNANKMGTDMESIKNAYQGFAKQNYTMLDNLKLGYGGTQKEMQRLLTDAQKISGAKYDISNLADVYSAIHVIQGELGITGTTAVEAATTIQGSFASMKAAAKNVMGQLAVGENVKPASNALADTMATYFAGNLLPAIGNIILGLPGALVTFVRAVAPEFANQLSEVVPEMLSGLLIGIPKSYPHFIAMARKMMNELRVAIRANLPQILEMGVQIVTDIASGILQGLPTLMFAISDLLYMLTDAILPFAPRILQAGADLCLNLVHGIIENLPQILIAAATLYVALDEAIRGHLPQILQQGIEIIGKLAAGLIRAIPTLVSKVPEIIVGITGVLQGYDWLSIGKNIIRGIANGLKSAAGELWAAVKDVLGSFKDKVLGFFGIHSPSRWGVYVGKMIDTGLANGIAGNVSLVSSAADELRARTVAPIEAINGSYRIDGHATNSTNETAGRLDELIAMLGLLVNKDQKISVTIGEREFIRLLRDIGVVFA